MASKKSALTAALSGAPGQTSKPEAKLDPSVFPGLGGTPLSADDVVRSLEELNLDPTKLPSSVPSGKLPSNLVDYDIPINPRSGREGTLPSSLKPGSLASNYLTQATIGSLPSALSVQQRENILASTPLSPTLNLINSLPSDKVGSRSLEGRRLRRHVLRGAVIVFVTAGYRGKRFIFEKAKELGVRSVILDGPDSWSQELVEAGVVEKFLPIDMADGETLFERALEAVKKAREELGDLDGVCSFAEMAMPLVSRLVDALGLPGNPASAVDDARDKHATRARMQEVGLPTPRNYLIQDPADLAAASAHVGYPAVIKPIYGAASLGVVRVDDEPALHKAFERVTKEMASAKIEAGALVAGDESEEDEGASNESGEGDAKKKGNADGWIKTTIMMEEYLDGPEVDVDVIFSESAPVFGAVTDNWPTLEPYFNETGSNAPSILPPNQQRELLDLAVASVKALGFNMGVFHVECKYTSRGPRLIEVNCRMGGGPVRNMNLLVWGVDLVEEQLLLTAGIPSRPPVADKPLTQIAEFSVNALITGTLESNDYLETFAKRPDVLYCRPTVEAGSKVVCVEDGMPTWVCEMMVSKDDVLEAIDAVKSIEQEIQKIMPIKPKAPKAA